MFLINWYYKIKEKHLKKKLGFCGRDNNILQPCHCGFPQNVYLDDYTLIQPNCTIIITPPREIRNKKILIHLMQWHDCYW